MSPNLKRNSVFKWKACTESRKFIVFTNYADVGILKIKFHQHVILPCDTFMMKDFN